MRELLRGHSVYEPVSAVNVVPYRPGELSLPTCLRQAPLITEVCSDRARKYLEGEGERMLRSGPDVQQLLEEVGEPRRFVDSRLARSPRLYAQLVQELDGIDYLQFTRTPWGAWAFSVLPKSPRSYGSFWTRGRRTCGSGFRRARRC